MPRKQQFIIHCVSFQEGGVDTCQPWTPPKITEGAAKGDQNLSEANEQHGLATTKCVKILGEVILTSGDSKAHKDRLSSGGVFKLRETTLRLRSSIFALRPPVFSLHSSFFLFHSSRLLSCCLPSTTTTRPNLRLRALAVLLSCCLPTALSLPLLLPSLAATGPPLLPSLAAAAAVAAFTPEITAAAASVASVAPLALAVASVAPFDALMFWLSLTFGQT
ncbi:uncharacterized protein LOC116247501 [Nymphaea colorata]|uniref:uncharacterized protein LOC116247501 n=1 Tax=Nymphaea colorata TaxID=210225 RepID=UPI00129EBB66|nr:uncharacterized protein LOC116247501 [Nymphaea colorata]